MPRRMEASLHTPLPRLLRTITAARVRMAMSQFCQEPYTMASGSPFAITDS